MPLGVESDPSGKRQKRPGWSTSSGTRAARWNVASWNRCAWNSASASSSPAPEPGADHHRPPPAPGCTRRSGSQPPAPAQTKGQSSSAHRAACPGLFLLPIFHACRPGHRLPGLPDQCRHDNRAACPMTAPAHNHRSRSPRPPAPPASSRPTAPAAPAPHR